MSKYNPLWQYIKDNKTIELSFEQIKKILGFKIDHSFLSFKKELFEYGYEVDKISLKGNKVSFKKR